MKICHFSDWHTKFHKLPNADLYICTGDMYNDNYMFVQYGMTKASENNQLAWATQSGGPKMATSIPKYKEVVCVRGNHDFIDLSLLFGTAETLETHEFGLEFQVLDIQGLRIGGVRGIPRIREGGSALWCDEHTPERLREHVFDVKGFEPVDILVTHGPPRGILDDCNYNGEGLCPSKNSRCVGARAINEAIKILKPKLHCFGHIHECGGKVIDVYGVLHSNASGGFNVIDL